MGTGWYELEHRRHGFPFEDLDTRFRRLEEHLQVVTRLWDATQQPFDFAGAFVDVVGAVFTPVPDPRPRLAIGGAGMRRTPQLAARFADELNGVLMPPAQCAEQRAALTAACESIDRDPAAVRYSVMTGCIVGATQQEFTARMRRLLERHNDGRSVEEAVAARSASAVLGTVEQARERLGELAAAGVEAVMLQDLLPDDLEMVDLIAEELTTPA
jgi:alkanesulfonate monooxygenase SsuD/methylene tetrahydromethanopterin reductase-like flavin-dependent oxidoreductase (luciferase family)